MRRFPILATIAMSVFASSVDAQPVIERSFQSETVPFDLCPQPPTPTPGGGDLIDRLSASSETIPCPIVFNPPPVPTSGGGTLIILPTFSDAPLPSFSSGYASPNITTFMADVARDMHLQADNESGSD